VEIFGAEYMIPALLALVVSVIFAHSNTIYRTQRQTYVQRQILPGYSTRRVKVPAFWQGKTLVELDIRKEYDVNVVGLLEKRGEDGLPHVRPNPEPNLPLEQGDIIVVLGQDVKLEALTKAIRAGENAV
jgi:K+/H+ antiporter YhaU regulatory subunit KhtT